MNTAPITIAMAFCRSCGVNSTGITAIDSGRITAAPSPSTARAAMSSPDVCEYEQASGQQRRGQHEAVSVDEPLQVTGGGVQIGPEGGQGQVEHGQVQAHDQD